LASSIEQLKEFLGGCDFASDEVVGLALKKCKMDVSEAMLMLTVEENINDL